MVEEVIIRVIRIMVDSGSEYLPKDAQTKGIEVLPIVTNVDGIDYRILLEADFLVNAFEDNASIESIQHAKESFFETETGKHILDTMFNS